MDSKEVEVKPEHQMRFLKTIKATPGITFTGLLAELVTKDGPTRTDVFRVQGKMVKDNLVKRTGGYGHLLTHEGEHWLTMHMQDEANSKPVERKSGILTLPKAA